MDTVKKVRRPKSVADDLPRKLEELSYLGPACATPRARARAARAHSPRSPPPASMAHRVGATAELAALLASLDLSAFLAAFVEENLDDRSMFSLREGDLRSLGIPPSARRRFLEAVEERRMDGHSWDALDQLRRDRDVAWAEVARLRAFLRRRKTGGITLQPFGGYLERRPSFSPSSEPPSPALSVGNFSQSQMGFSQPGTPSSIGSFFRAPSNQKLTTRVDDRRRTGRVLWFRNAKFGFLSQDCGDPDIFAHASDFNRAPSCYGPGDRVEYSLAEFNGRPKAVEIVFWTRTT